MLHSDWSERVTGEAVTLPYPAVFLKRNKPLQDELLVENNQLWRDNYNSAFRFCCIMLMSIFLLKPYNQIIKTLCVFYISTQL